MIFRLSPESFFVRQNTWLKLCILIVGSIAAVAVPVKALFYLSAVTLMYLLISPAIYRCLLQGLRVLLPFIAAYSLTATILGESLGKIIIIALRIIIMVFMVTYFAASLNMNRLLEDSISKKSNKHFRAIMFYVVATLIYIKQFASYYSGNPEKSKTGKSGLSELASGIVDSIHENWQKKDDIQVRTEQILAENYLHPAFLTMYNVWACIYLTVLILILAL